jgi:hypothetical protein
VGAGLYLSISLERFRRSQKEDVGLSVFKSSMCFLLCSCILVLIPSRSSAPTGLFINYILFVDSLALNKLHPPLKSCHPFLLLRSIWLSQRYSSPASIEWFYRGPGFLAPVVWLLLPPPSPSPVSKLSLLLSHPACNRPRFLTGVGRGRGGSKSCDSEKARFSINHWILSAALYRRAECVHHLWILFPSCHWVFYVVARASTLHSTVHAKN